MTDLLKNKVAIVTGGSNGIGASIVSLFLEKGAKVASLDVIEQAASTESLLNIKCNVSSEESVNDAVREVMEKFSKIDILVNCAGVMDGFERTGDVSNSVWNRCMAVNVNGPMYMMKAVIPHFLSNATTPVKGSIVNIGSAASMRAGSAGVAYTTSKHALLGLSRSTTWMYSTAGIRCNIVLPGGIETNIMQNSAVPMNQEGYEMLKPSYACMRGHSKPIEVAKTVLFLATSEAVNGAEVTVDLGWGTV